MEDNPYKAPGDDLRPFRPRRPTLTVWLVGTPLALGVALAMLVAAAMIVLPFFVDIRENPRYWDEIERREKMGMSEEQAAESIDQDQAAGRWP